MHRELAEETGRPPGAGRPCGCGGDVRVDLPDGHHSHYRLYAAAVDLTDADIVVGEGRQIVFVDPGGRARRSTWRRRARHFVPAFLDSDLYRSLRSTS